MCQRSQARDDEPDPEAIEAAARELIRWGYEDGWFSRAEYDRLDPVCKRQFNAIARRVLVVARAATPIEFPDLQ